MDTIGLYFRLFVCNTCLECLKIETEDGRSVSLVICFYTNSFCKFCAFANNNSHDVKKLSEVKK